jgi:hypothetical protein
MNCDQVFDILTRGPFPTGTSCDVPVEAHLSECHECHRLAEALRPAIELFQEAVDPEESRDLPGYWCAVSTERQSTERHSPALSYAREIEPRAIASQVDAHAASHPLTALSMWRMAAMLAVGVTVGTLLATRGLDGFDWPPRGIGAALAPAPEDPSPQVSRGDWMELASLHAACYSRRPTTSSRYRLRDDQLLADANLKNLSCCSGCHNSGSDKVPSTATSTVMRSCQHCHGESGERLISSR